MQRISRGIGCLLMCWLMLACGMARAQAVYIPKPLEDTALLTAISKPVLCATKNQITNEGTVSGAGLTYRIPQVFPFACYNMQWVFNNSCLLSYAAGAEGSTGTLTLKVGFEYPVGTISPVTFNGGNTTVVIPIGGMVKSDPLGIALPAGAVGRIRTYVQSSSSQIPIGGISNPFNGDLSDMVTAGNTDLSYVNATGGTFSNGFSTNNSTGWYGPIGTTGYPVNPASYKPGFILYGDSISRGAQDQPNSTSPTTKIGWLSIGSNDTVPWINCSISGDAAHNFTYNATMRKLLAMVSGVKYALIAYGANDVDISGSSLVQLKADLQSIYTELAGRGLRVIACTITPKTNSASDNTPVALDLAIRMPANAWIRAGTPTGVFDYIDMEAAVSTIGSGSWTALGMTGDGNHPSNYGHNLMAASFAAKLSAGTYK